MISDPAVASAVQSKTIKLGMSPDEVKQSLGNPDKIVDLGTKQVYVYKDMKVVFLNNQVQTFSKPRRGLGNVEEAGSTGLFQGPV